jgi:hypothetical protein
MTKKGNKIPTALDFSAYQLLTDSLSYQYKNGSGGKTDFEALQSRGGSS